jgi:hypothetical protein
MMKNQNSQIILWLGLGLAVFTLACQTLTDLAVTNATLPTPTPIAWPHSAFVPPLERSQVMLGEPLALETHHLTRMTDQLIALRILVNGQPIRTEETAGQVTFPPELATFHIVTVEQPEQVVLADVEPFLPPTCQDVLEQEGVVLHSPLSRYPSSDWNVCYIWVGHVPGTYDVSMQVVDSAGNESEFIIQRIEVVEPGP